MYNIRNNREIITILFLCLLWYAVSSSSNVVGKMLLSEFPYPLTVTMVQLTSITVYSGPFFNLWGVRKYSSNISWSYYLRLIVPLALGKFLANVFSHVSIWKVPVSYAHTGTDSRVGLGFRLGEHADFQIIFELGPQIETDSIGTSNDAKKRRDVMFNAAIKGELGPLAQATAKYQIERRIQKEMDKLKAIEEKLKKIQTENIKNQDTISNNWLTKWRQEISELSKNENTSLNLTQNEDGKII